MPTTPTRLRNWSRLVRTATELSEYEQQVVANMLEYCAGRIELLEGENRALHTSLDDVVRWNEEGDF